MRTIAFCLSLLLVLSTSLLAKPTTRAKRGTDAKTKLPTSLPDRLLSFTGTREGDQVLLNWSIAGKDNNDFFTLERSNLASEWKKVARINNAEYSTEVTDYSYADNYSNNATTYYRVKETNFYGGFTYSKVISVGAKPIEGALTRLP